MQIMLTNDDGIYAAGLRAMYRRLLGAGHEVYVVAPLDQQSAVGHAVTMTRPLRVQKIVEADFTGLAVSGTPTDCVKLGVSSLLPWRPDLVVSGMNAGANVGPDVLYSGTVAAATEAAAMGLASFAVSHHSFSHLDLNEYAAFATEQLARIPWPDMRGRRVMNLNLPACPYQDCRGLCLCPQTNVPWRDWYEERKDPRGASYWWLDGEIPMELVERGTDKYQLERGYATLTPLKFEFTDHEALQKLARALPGVELFAAAR